MIKMLITENEAEEICLDVDVEEDGGENSLGSLVTQACMGAAALYNWLESCVTENGGTKAMARKMFEEFVERGKQEMVVSESDTED